MKRILIVLTVLSIFLVVACAQTTQEVVEEVVPTEPSVEVKERPTAPTPEPAAPQVSTKEVQDLLDKHKGTTNYEYSYDLLEPSAIHRVHVLGDKLRTHLDRPKSGTFSRGDFISDVFIDRFAKTAVGACLISGTYCDEEQPAVTVGFSMNNLETPVDLVSQIEFAEKVDEVLYDRKEVARLSFKKGTRDAMVWLDKFNGLPVRVEVYNTQGDIVEQHTYTDLATDSVKESDVTLPSTLTIQDS